MAKPKKNLIRNVIAVGAVLLAIQIAVIVIFRKDPPLTARQSIERAIVKYGGLDAQRKAQLHVQLAVSDYAMNNKGVPPPDLGKLVPVYFDAVPNDPATGKPFEYKVEGKKYFIGSGATQQSSEKGGVKGSPESLDGQKLNKEEEAALIASLDKEERFVYNPSNRKDPFRPFDFSPDLDVPSDKPPLERYDLSKLRMTAILDIGGEAHAMVEDPNGIGHSVKKGYKIGLRGGEVVDILEDRVVVLETEVDFAGESRTRTVDVLMKGPDERQGPGTGTE